MKKKEVLEKELKEIRRMCGIFIQQKNSYKKELEKAEKSYFYWSELFHKKVEEINEFVLVKKNDL